jgi:hypothetical protein
MSETKYRAVVTDSVGYVLDADEVIAHLRECFSDNGCEDCGSEVSVRTGSALPNPLSDRIPSSWTSGDILVEHDLMSEEVADAIRRIEQCRLIADALNAYAPANPSRLSPSSDLSGGV